MSHIHRFFLVIEGKDTAYPNYSDAVIHFLKEEPSTLRFTNTYICSPVFSVLESGSNSIPTLEDEAMITFIMMPQIYPFLYEIINHFSITNELWFSLGLANLIIIEKGQKGPLSEKIINHLKAKSNITASETWSIKNKKIKKHALPYSQLEHVSKEVVQIELKNSDRLPLHLKFAVSEFKIFSNKFLTASKKFTPHYYTKHLKTVEASAQLIHDLSFLHGDYEFVPDSSLLSALGAPDIPTAKKILDGTDLNKRKEELINDRNGRLIQFNSSLSYVYSQSYSGTFPLFDHTGIIQRHSLLGVGSAISSLTELLSQIEGALYHLPFEHIDASTYASSYVQSLEYYQSFQEVSSHDPQHWNRDLTRTALIKASDPNNHSKLPDDFFNRLAFFSGRLGFREYDLSATAAIQVVVEANSLQWNIINYTHEIIHNHVRIILNQLLIPSLSVREEEYEAWIKKYLSGLSNIFRSISRSTIPDQITYKDYFILILLKYCVNFQSYGSLSKVSNQELLLKLKSDTSKREKYRLPTQNQLSDLVLNLYKDITEIFVHIIDYCYIYSKDRETYLQSIWASWSTVTSVANDLKQYIIRALIIIGLSEDGNIAYRYNSSKRIFIASLEKIAGQNGNAYLFSRIKEILEDVTDEDLKSRFHNCIIIGDLIYNFFVGDLEAYLDNQDENRISKSIDEHGDRLPFVYGIERNSFQGNEIKSKARFLLDQLIRETLDNTSKYQDDFKERTSAWLLLSLSSL